MKLKTCLIFLTLISVVCDTLLLPFYPQFFTQAFGVDSPEHVGWYLAACCISVMVAFPLWAKVAKRVHELHLWVYTQVIAAVLGLSCYLVSDLLSFWVLSQLMLVFKASYLLIYPLVMRLESEDKHLGMVGLFAVLMHFGGIGGALLGGMVLEVMNPKAVYLIMAAGDLVQVALCVYLIKRLDVEFWQQHQPPAQADSGSQSHIWGLGIVTLLVYGCSFLARPFFSTFWAKVSGLSNEIIAAWVYAIPAWAALASLWYQHRRSQNQNNSSEQHQSMMISALAVGAAGLLLQGSSWVALVIIGRLMFGLALFQAMVRLDVLLFQISKPEHYGRDFSKIHIFQNVGVIMASFAVGPIVAAQGVAPVFIYSAAGFALTAVMFYWFFINYPGLNVNRVTE